MAQPPTRPLQPGPLDPAPHRPGQTTANIAGDPVPRLPHERDESADSQQMAPDAKTRQAHSDLQDGFILSDREQATNDTYNRELRQPTREGVAPGKPEDPASR